MNCAASRGIATGRAHGGASFTQPYGAHLLPFRPRDRVIGSVSPAPPPTSIGPEDSARAASLRSLPFCPTGSSRSSTGSSARSGSAFPARVFGQALIALGTPVPGAHRAADPSRHAGRDSGIYALAAASKQVSQKVSTLARGRVGALQDHRRRAASAARDRRRSTPGPGDRRLAAVSAVQPAFIQLVRARRAGIVATLAGHAPRSDRPALLRFPKDQSRSQRRPLHARFLWSVWQLENHQRRSLPFMAIRRSNAFWRQRR
jgi:hypothetical protein